jgi:hypothetical protein
MHAGDAPARGPGTLIPSRVARDREDFNKLLAELDDLDARTNGIPPLPDYAALNRIESSYLSDEDREALAD